MPRLRITHCTKVAVDAKATKAGFVPDRKSSDATAYIKKEPLPKVQ